MYTFSWQCQLSLHRPPMLHNNYNLTSWTATHHFRFLLFVSNFLFLMTLRVASGARVWHAHSSNKIRLVQSSKVSWLAQAIAGCLSNTLTFLSSMGAVGECITTVQLVASLQEVRNSEKLFQLFLTGRAFAVYQIMKKLKMLLAQ